MPRACKLCGGPLPGYGTRPYQDCVACERRILEIATQLPRPAVYNDFQELRPLGQAGGHYLRWVKAVLLRNNYICHEARNVGTWDCDFAHRWASVVGGKLTHFHSPVTLTN